ncbi:hypothetical protein BK124_11375 [Paenibacillus amylolyticus]|uniref:helix-turn-helix domain-containing protein n=1 Tax=Paenibacillus amylolyticus TaxID=1451 RepID=UPI00096DDFF0|nr:helix-turn-helix domain-containing protein [Paenibacillus amylolyticus]OMF00253.1 hypothetical protein BK124_11375 [Paenibacillus amylolyticus]
MGYKPGRCLLTKRLREIKRSQQWLADVTGIPKSSISEYANKKRTMSIATAMTIAAAVGCYIDDLYERIEVSSD